MSFKVLLTLVILCGVLIGAGVGALTSRLRGAGQSTAAPAVGAAQRSTALPAEAAQQRGSAAAGAGQRSPGGAAGQMMAGTIENIEGNVLTLRLPNGNHVRVTVTDATAIRRIVPGTLSDLSVGQVVTVAGERGEDSSATARMIQVMPEGTLAGQDLPAQGQDTDGRQAGSEQAGQRRTPPGGQARQGGAPAGR
jgi:hypothetical protein